MTRRLALLPAGLVTAAATIIVAAAVVPLVTPLRAQIVTSGSMVPAIPVGAMVLTVPLDRLADPGEVILFAHPSGAATVLHRVVAVEHGAIDSDYVTKGDANDTTDGWRVPVHAVTGRVIAAIPLVGFGVGTLQRPAARLGVGILILAFVLIPAVGRLGRRTIRPRPVPIAVAMARGDEHAGHDHLAAWLAQRRRAVDRRGSRPRSAAA